jgi:PASTA domain
VLSSLPNAVAIGPRPRIGAALLVVTVAAVLGLGASDAAAAVPISSLRWTQLTPLHSPPAMFNGTLAYEPPAERLLLFGGVGKDEEGHEMRFNQSGTWDGSDWADLSPAVSPPAKYASSIAYDDATGEVVLFNESGETWTWDGSAWADATPALASESPSPRLYPQIAYDAATEQLLLFSGETGYFTYAEDTWEWDGTSWTELTPAHSPLKRAGGAMAYDAATEQLLLFGGLTINRGVPTNLSDTWAWTGTDWEAKASATSPSARANGSMAYDAAAERLILFGGSNQNLSLPGGTWAWDGSGWESLTLPLSPPERAGGGMAYDEASEQIILFAGNGAAGELDDTWALAPPSAPSVTIDSLAPATLAAGQGATLRFHAGQVGSYDLRLGGTDCASGTVIASGSYAAESGEVSVAIDSGVLAVGLNQLRLCLAGENGQVGQASTSITLEAPVTPAGPASSSTNSSPALDQAPPSPAPPACSVPNLKGKSLKAAKKKIKAAGCKAGKVTKAKGATAKTGKIKTQSPKPGKSLAAGTKVNVRLAS